MEDVDDAHAKVRTATEQIATIEMGSLNETEREHAYVALGHLQQLDAAMAERSGFEHLELSKDILGDVEEADDA